MCQCARCVCVCALYVYLHAHVSFTWRNVCECVCVRLSDHCGILLLNRQPSVCYLSKLKAPVVFGGASGRKRNNWAITLLLLSSQRCSAPPCLVFLPGGLCCEASFFSPFCLSEILFIHVLSLFLSPTSLLLTDNVDSASLCLSVERLSFSLCSLWCSVFFFSLFNSFRAS